MAKRKGKDDSTRYNNKFHRDFREPNDKDRQEALGDFSITEQTQRPPESFWQCHPCQAPEDLDDAALYQPTRSVIPPPNFDLDWLAQVPEPGQTVSQYIVSLTSRSGRLRPFSNAAGTIICLLPIVAAAASQQECTNREGSWPSHAPKLEALAELTGAYFQRPVRLLHPALIGGGACPASSGGGTGQKAQSKSGAQSTLSFFNNDGKLVLNTTIVGRHHRHDSSSERIKRQQQNCSSFQYQVMSLLSRLAEFRQNHYHDENFCIMGVTVEDLYHQPDDLFCAGMANGANKVAIFSFFRYHPHLRMSPQTWWEYGYSSKPGSYSYFDAAQGPRSVLTPDLPFSLPPPPKENDSPKKKERPTASCLSTVEYFRRSGKLLLHELGHLYGVGHCIHYRCLMMGTGHLVEDFGVPLHLCGVCLRKMQWRLGFSVQQRYQDIATILKENGLTKEAGWIRRELTSIQKKKETK